MFGSTIWARSTLDSDVFLWKPDKWFKIWFYLIMRANYKDIGKFKRGEFFTTYAEISDRTNATRDQIDQFIRWSKSCGMLTTQKTTRGMIVFINKYAQYQDAIKIKNDTKNETKTTQKRHRNDTIVETVKKDNQYNSVENKFSTSIKIKNETFMLEELTYELEDAPKGKNKYGNKVMAVLVRKFCEVAGIEIGKTFDASEWAKPLSELYRRFNKDPDKTMQFIEDAGKWYSDKSLTFTPHTLEKNFTMLKEKWLKKETNDPRYN